MKHQLIIISCFAVFYFYLKQKVDHVSHITSAEAMLVDPLPGSSPHFTKDFKGNTVLSWVKMINDSSAIFCYKLLRHGKTTGETVEIQPSKNINAHSENIPKIIFKPGGEIIAVWGIKNPSAANKYSGLINYSQSFDGGKTWGVAKNLVKDTAGYDQRYADVALLANGEVVIIWLDNRKTTEKEGSALYMATTKGTKGFRRERLVSQPVCPCCRTSLFVDSRNNIHAVYRGILNDSIRDMVHVVSNNGGKTFSAPEKIYSDNWVLRGCPHTGPAMTENNEGLHFAWFTKNGTSYIRSTDNGATFDKHDMISMQGTHPQLESLHDNELVVVWDESVQIGSRYYKRIGMQVRTNEGLRPVNEFITPDTSYSTYPVVSAIDNDAVLVAYSVKSDKKEYVKWQEVVLER
jgi:hypothetical protein